MLLSLQQAIDCTIHNSRLINEVYKVYFIIHTIEKPKSEYIIFNLQNILMQGAEPIQAPQTLGDQLNSVFEAYAIDRIHLEGKQFAKIFRDCSLIDKKLTQPEIDIAFAKAKQIKTERKLNFEEFLLALDFCAQKKGIPTETLAYELVARCHGPLYVATITDQVRLHDDKTTYTGVYAQGGPRTVDGSPKVTISKLGLEEFKNDYDKSPKVSFVAAQPASTLEEVYAGFTFSQPDMDGKTFVKLFKDCKILDKKLTTTDLDILFSKIKAKGQRKIGFEQFLTALQDISQLKGITFDQLKNQICSVGGPVFTGTRAEKVKWHDDKSTYTGVYAKGGPETVDIGRTMINDIRHLCDRSEADIRGVKKH